MRNEPPSDLPELPEGAKLEAQRGRIIDAIRITREASACGLREAKDAVDAYVKAHPPYGKRNDASPEAGCRGVVLLLALAAAAAIAYQWLR